MSSGSYTGISVREVLDLINKKQGGWFLPHIQRQYVWGSRSSSEEYICLLLDSLLQGYPIGGIVLWETSSAVPYREFLGDYEGSNVAKIVDECLWDAHKYLVYDGQQRLQTLYSVLYHTFNKRVLCFDLLYSRENDEYDGTGFYFKNCTEPLRKGSIEIPKVMRGDNSPQRKRELRESIRNASDDFSTKEKDQIEEKFDLLWSTFVTAEIKAIAYYSVKSDDPLVVNEVFRRLNTGGVQLTQLEMVLAKCKQIAPFFEEDLWELSEFIAKATGNSPGLTLSAHELVQLIYLLVFQTTRVDEGKVTSHNVQCLIDKLDVLKCVLPTYYQYFFYELFHINTSSIIIRQQAILPLLVYTVICFENGHAWEPHKINTLPMSQYFIKSQLCDWNTQTMVTAFARQAMEAAENGQDFPVDSITEIAVAKNRTRDIYTYQFESARWFALKVVTPARTYLFHDKTPQIDHIFPEGLKNGETGQDEYKTRVNVIWNLQPTPAGVNNYKRCKHPKDFFRSDEGKAFFCAYDFLPEVDNEIWDSPEQFFEERKQAMIRFVKERYDLDMLPNPS